jgi:NAD(P)-dependent dehydrogenase (short-subunit alcohol dehydrogenase family)
MAHPHNRNDTPELRLQCLTEFPTTPGDLPLGRVGQADEFAATIVFLGSRALSYMATTMVMVDDGTVAQ